jgi:hypothetical protein
MPQDRRRPVEREVRHHTKRLVWKPNGSGVSLHDLDVRPPAAEAARHARVELYCDHMTGGARELGGQPARPGAEIEHEILAAYAGVTNELGGQRL